MNDPVAQYIRTHWRYDPRTGLIHGRLDKPIGTLSKRDGRLRAMAYPEGGRPVSVLIHRAAWLLQTGAWPSHEVDHRNRQPADNRWDNLREATRGQNQQNRAAVNGKGRLLGCTPYYRKWKATIRVNNSAPIYLGLHDTEEQAHQAYLDAKARLHTFQPVPA